ncbi:GNAT family N-acetyltransferase [Crossiella equi]|uniref:GNAT family N-acetyltransferase n=1 Tax=Crossiella equi TaxID=130796 RepID=UPI001B800560
MLGHVVLKGVGGEPEVGYWVVERARGCGVASRVLAAVTRWGFETFEPVRIRLRHQADNTASCRVAERCGYLRVDHPLAEHLHVAVRSAAGV